MENNEFEFGACDNEYDFNRDGHLDKDEQGIMWDDEDSYMKHNSYYTGASYRPSQNTHSNNCYKKKGDNLSKGTVMEGAVVALFIAALLQFALPALASGIGIIAIIVLIFTALI